MIKQIILDIFTHFSIMDGNKYIIVSIDNGNYYDIIKL